MTGLQQPIGQAVVPLLVYYCDWPAPVGGSHQEPAGAPAGKRRCFGMANRWMRRHRYSLTLVRSSAVLNSRLAGFETSTPCTARSNCEPGLKLVGSIFFTGFVVGYLPSAGHMRTENPNSSSTPFAYNSANC